MVECSDNKSKFQINFNHKLLAHFCTSLGGGYTLLGRWSEIDSCDL